MRRKRKQIQSIEQTSRRVGQMSGRGVLLLDVLSEMQRAPDFLVVTEKLDPPCSGDRSLDDDLIDRREFSLSHQITRYSKLRRPSDIANFKLVCGPKASHGAPFPDDLDRP